LSKGNGRYGSTGLPRTTLFDIIQFSLYFKFLLLIGKATIKVLQEMGTFLDSFYYWIHQVM